MNQRVNNIIIKTIPLLQKLMVKKDKIDKSWVC